MEFFSLKLCYLCVHSIVYDYMKYPIFVFVTVLLMSGSVMAQYNEPEIQPIVQPKNLFDEGYKKGFGFSFGLNDFGFGAGMQYRRGISPHNELLLNFKIAGLRDPSEQTYVDYYFGNRTVASKYQRVITFPIMFGFKHRLFANQISDNFRVHTSMSLGPSFSVVLPYFNDNNGNGYREDGYYLFGYDDNNEPISNYSVEPVNDIFQGWKDAKTEIGWNGELVLGIDFGENFARIQSLQFGYSFYYFKQGLQILEPNQPIIQPDGSFLDKDEDRYIDFPEGFEHANDPINYFGSAQITFIFGWMWN